MNTFETAAVLKLVDHLTGPMNEMVGKVAGHESALGRHAARMSDIGQRMTLGVTVPVVAGLKEMADKAVEFSRIENTMRGVLEQRARSVDNLTVSTKAYAAAQLEAVTAAAQSAYDGVGGLPKGLANVKEYRESILAAVKAGYQDTTTTDAARSMIPAEALANQATVLSVANRVDAHTATDDLIALSNSLQVETRDKEGHALGIDELNKKFGHIADVLSTMYTSSNFADHHEVVQSLKMAAPLARFAGLDIGQIAMMSATQKEAGFRGDESSVAQRSMIGSFLAPKNSAYGAFAAIGLNLHNYQSAAGTMSPASFVKRANMAGYKVAMKSVDAVFDRFKGEGDDHADLDKLTTGLREAVMATGKAKNPIKPEIAQKFADQYLSTYVKSMDVARLIEDIRNTGQANVSWWAQVGEKRQAPRLLPILNPPATKEARDEFVNEGQRQYGPNWEMMMGMKGPIAPGPTPQSYVMEQAGIAARQAAEHAKSLEGAYLQVHNAFEMVVSKMADRHVFDAVANDIVRVMDAFAQLDPKVIEFGTEAALAAAAIGPLLSVMGFIVGLGPAAAKVLPMLRGSVGGLAESAARAAPAVEHGAAALGRLGNAARSVAPTLDEVAENAAARLAALRLSTVRAAEQEATQASIDSMNKVIRGWAATDEAAAEASRRTLMHYATAQRGATMAAEEMAEAAQRQVGVAAETAAKVAAEAEKAGAATVRVALSLDGLSGAADRAAAAARRQLANVAAFAERNAAEAAARAAAATERGMARQEIAVARYEASIATRLAQIGERIQTAGAASSEALSKVLGDFVRLNPAAEQAAQAAQRAVSSAVEASARAAEVGDRLIAAQAAENAAKQAATAAADRLAEATRAAAQAMGDLAQRQGTARAAEQAAAQVARGSGRAAQEALARGADGAAKASAEAAAKEATRHAEFVAKQAATAAEEAARRGAVRAGVFKLAAGVLEGANPLIDLYSAIEIGQARMEREHQVVGRQAIVNGGRRTYRDVSVGHYDPSYLEHDDAVGAARIYDRAIADRNRANPRDEGVRANAAYPGAGQPQHVEVSGTVEGKAELSNNITLTVQPSTYLAGLVARAESVVGMSIYGNLGEHMSEDMVGSNGIRKVFPARIGIGHM